MTATAAGPAPAFTAASAPRLGLGTKLSYGFGAVADGVKNAAFNTYLLLYFNQVVGVPATIVGTALACTLLVDAIVDPFFGRWGDVTRSRWGRRHPFIYGAALPTAIFFLFTWFPPAGLSDIALGFWIFAFAALTRTAISAYQINANAMAAELTDVYVERTKLFSFKYWFVYAGSFGFAAFSLAVIFHSTEQYPVGQLNPASYTAFALLGCALIFVAILVCGLGTHNRIRYLRQASVPQGRTPMRVHLREMVAAFRNRSFMAIFGFGVCKFTAIGVYAATTLYFGTYLFKLSSPQLAILTVDSLAAATIAAPLAPIFSEWFGKRTTAMVFAVVGVAIGLTPLVLSLFDLFFPVGHPLLVPTLFVIGAVYGSMVAISLINTSSMLADIVEDSAVETGRHTAGTFFAASSFMQQCSAALGLFIAGLLLTWSNFPEHADPATIPDATVDSLLIHYIPISFGLWSLGCLFLLFYPITKERHLQNLEILRAREAEARALDGESVSGAPAR